MGKQQVVMVTGASSGIGRAIAEQLAGAGLRVFGTSRKAAAENHETPPNLELARLDVRDDSSVRACVQTVLDRAGRIDALVNNAGYTLIGSLEETSIEEAKQLFETNFFGVLRMTQAVLPTMREQSYGRIVNVGSVAGRLPVPYQGIYSASKHALEGYSESLDHEVRQFGIRVSVVEPGFIRTSIDQNRQLVRQPLAPYSNDRNRVADGNTANVARGEDPSRVASLVVSILTSRSPRGRYLFGSQAKLTNWLRILAPESVFDKGLRKQFGLAGV